MKIALISVLAIIFVAGCTGTRPTTISGTEGVRISSFQATPSVTNVLSGDSVIFDLEVENVGGTTAHNIAATLYGIQSQWRDTAGGGLVSQVNPVSFTTLRPPQADRNIPGDFRAAQWQFKTPQIPEGLKTPLSIEARVRYDYTTDGFLQLTAVNDQEYRRQQIAGTMPESPIVQNSAGPLQLTVPSTAKSSFIIVDTTSSSNDFIYPLKIEFQNVGSGFPVGDENVATDLGKLTGTIKLLGPNVEFSNCLGQSGATVNLDASSSTDVVVRLRDTQNVPIVCNLRFTNLQNWKSTPTEKISLVFDITYRYFTKQSVTVNVLGRNENNP